MFDLMPIDAQGNVYMKQLNPGSTTSNIYVIGPDGLIRTLPWQYDSKYGNHDSYGSPGRHRLQRR